MRKIDKRIILAEKYKKWLDELSAKGSKHTIYNSSNGKFYYDIIANLIWVQAGLCAYSERRLQNHAQFGPPDWQEGVFKKFQFAGQLDHYDASLKKEYGWLWDNFFLIDADINVKLKRDKKPSGILKPDLGAYDPAAYLEYKIADHIFLPNRALDFAIQEQVNKDISCLGLNFQPIIDIRREYLSPLMFDVEYKIKTFEEVRNEMNQFFTAFELSRELIDH
jgi:hypothetical protein